MMDNELDNYKTYAEELIKLQAEEIHTGLAANEYPLSLLDQNWEVEDVSPLNPWEI